MGGEERGLLVRRARAGPASGRDPQLTAARRFGLDGAVVPGLLLLLARDLALYDAPRVLAWRLSHDERLAAAAAWLGPLLPAPSGALDRDPIALLLAFLAALLALAYAGLAAARAGVRPRAAVIALGALVLVALPSLAFMGMGAATERPYGQDGGVVQLPLALDRILAGASPYGADYSGTMLARQARVSSFWDGLGGNPILRHHAYLPGTHLVMLPFHIVSKAALGFFDPRSVTLLFYGLVVWLAWRIPGGADEKLAAAGIAALNPLVYWHQIFGANDLVFVGMLLAAVLAARGSRALAAGALIGLACATKQLAWPFAPFLLAALSGARSFADLAARATWRRLAGPAVAAAAVFVVVVAPVAALDPRAFWGDIVAYNVGLPGGDNYPIGGTPGFGAANFLIYFGRVTELREYFPFSAFYLLLLPLGLLLLRSQLRDGRAEWALATGSAALVASVYFSRVAHPNYLIPAAVLLPLAVLSCRRGADVALAPLLLLALAVELAEQGLLRAAWEQAAAAGFERVTGLLAVLVPRAGSHMTSDPLGLLASAVAAGLAVAYLALAVGGASRRVRVGVVAAGGVLLVLAPSLFLARIGGRTGVVRAQDPGVVQAAADAGRLLDRRSPYTPPPESLPRGREAVSASFRLDPPAELLPARPLLPPGPALVALVSRGLGTRDLRPALVCALGALGAAVSLVLAGRARRGALAVAWLAAPLALGTVLGAPAALGLATLLFAWTASERRRDTLAAVLSGLAAAFDHRLVLAAPFVAWRGGPPRQALRPLGLALAAYAAVVLPVALLDLPGFFGRLFASGRDSLGLGFVNLLAYRGGEALADPLRPIGVLAMVAAVGWLTTRDWPRLVKAGMASLAAIALTPSASAEVVGVPLLLLGLAAMEGGGARVSGEPSGEPTSG